MFFNYDLFLNLEGNPPVNHLRCEKLTFNNPTKEFRRKLIKAGGVRLPFCIVAAGKKALLLGGLVESASDLCSVVGRAVAVAFPLAPPCPAVPCPTQAGQNPNNSAQGLILGLAPLQRLPH